ncbi:MAG: hypothetical protein ACRC33_20985 [Gemmataceae bacterium]
MESKELPASKTEAIRRAVEALGYHASVDQILDYVREHFDRPTPADAGRAAPAPGTPNAARRGKK